MTGAQANWLASHKRYRVTHRTAGHSRFVDVGVLYPDGTFVARKEGLRLPISEGCFEVGVLENPEAGAQQSQVRR